MQFTTQLTKTLAIAIAASFLLSACTPQHQWMRSGSTREEFDKESAECKTRVRGSVSRNDQLSDVHERLTFCMERNGWVLVKTEDVERVEAMSPALKEYLVATKAIADDHKVEIAKCSKKAYAREIKNFAELTSCSDKKLTSIFERHHFPRMDLVEPLKQKHLEIYTRLDKEQTTIQQADREFNDFWRKMIEMAAPEPFAFPEPQRKPFGIIM